MEELIEGLGRVVIARVQLTNDEALAGQLLCEIDLVARRALDQLDVWQLVTNLDIGRRRGMEQATASRGGAGQTASSSKHGEGNCLGRGND